MSFREIPLVAHCPSFIAKFITLTAASLVFSIWGCASAPKGLHETKTAFISRIDTVLAKEINKVADLVMPVDETKIFSSADKQAVMLVKMKNITGKHSLKWEWYAPNGKLYNSTDEYKINNDGKTRDYITSWHKIAIKDEKAASLPGKWTAKVYLDQKPAAQKEFEIQEPFDLHKYISKGPVAKVQPDRHKWALIIGIEKYKKAAAVSYAEKDALMMKEYLINFLGVPAENTITLINDMATKAEIDVLIKDRLKGMLRQGDTLYLYYSGHGIPSDETPYMLPYDGDPESPRITAYSLEALYSDLDSIPAKDIFIFLDTCFSGRIGRDVKEEFIIAGARPGILKVKDPLLLSQKIVVMAAAKGNQLSNYYKEKGQGLFTYYLLKGLSGEADANHDKKVQLGELANYLRTEVDAQSRRSFGLLRQQTPVIMPSPLADRENLDIVDVVK